MNRRKRNSTEDNEDSQDKGKTGANRGIGGASGSETIDRMLPISTEDNQVNEGRIGGARDRKQSTGFLPVSLQKITKLTKEELAGLAKAWWVLTPGAPFGALYRILQKITKVTKIREKTEGLAGLALARC